MYRIALTATTLGFLAACGSSSSDGGASPTGGSSFATLETDYGTLSSNQSGQPFYDPANFATTGGLTYQGVYFQDLSADPNRDILGEVEIVSDLSADSMTSTVTNLVMRDGTALSGTLSGTGSFSRAGSPDIFFPTHGGTLTGGGDTFEITGNLQGDFSGASGEYLYVTGTGTMQINSGPAQGITGFVYAEIP